MAFTLQSGGSKNKLSLTLDQFVQQIALTPVNGSAMLGAVICFKADLEKFINQYTSRSRIFLFGRKEK